VASEFVDGVLLPVELPRFNFGGPSSSASRGADGADGRNTDPDVGAESPGVICALGVPSELPVARCSLGRSGSSLLFGELAEGLLGELPVVLSGLEAAWRNLGVSWSLPLDGPPGLLADDYRWSCSIRARRVVHRLRGGRVLVHCASTLACALSGKSWG